MRPEAIAQVLLVRAVEESDPKCDRLPVAEREQAAREAAARCPLPSRESSSCRVLNSREWAFLQTRAEILHDRVRAMAEVPKITAPAQLFVVALLLAAFLAGCLAHGAGLAHKFDVRAGPFLFVLVWNAVIYALLLWHSLPRPRREISHVWGGSIGTWLASRFQGHITSISVRDDAAGSRYAASSIQWIKSWIGPLLASWIHVASFCFALGLVASVYGHAYIGKHYAVGWESDLVGVRHVRTIWGSLLRPAAAITGIPLPTDDAAWKELDGFGGKDAKPWIHLHAVTVALFVGLPRLALAGWALSVATVRRRRPPAWKTNDPYVRRVFAMAYGGSGTSVAVLPFGFKRIGITGEGAYREAVGQLIREVWGWQSRAVWLPEVYYGDQDEAWKGSWRGADGCSAAVVLCDALATPEAEVHGVVLSATVQRFRDGQDGVLALLECAEFDPTRLSVRIEAWRALGAQHGLRFLTVELGSSSGESVELETFLLRS